MSNNEITEQLDLILESSEFSTKPLMGKLLTYLVTEFLEGRGDQIKGYSIGVDVFNQGENFDPDQNALVRINVGRLRRLLKMYYLEIGMNDPIYIDIPKGKYVPKIEENQMKSEDSPILQKNIITTEDITRSSIIVLPFKNFSNNDQLEYFSFGFSQELSSALIKFDDLKVLGNAFLRDGNNMKNGFTTQIKDRGIRFLVDGDFFMAKNQVKLSVRLMDVVDDIQVWGDNYKFSLEVDDLFEVQEKMAQNIASHIGAEYGLVNQKRSADLGLAKADTLNEHIVLLKFYYYQTVLSPESGMDLYENVSKALEVEPNSGILNAILSNVYGDMYGLDMPNSEGAFEKFGEYAEKAYSLSPKNPLVRAVLTFKCFMYDEKERFLQLSQKTLKWSPSSPLRMGGLAMFLSFYGDWEKGKELMDRIIEYNVEIPPYLYIVTSLYYYQQLDYEAALIEANKYHVLQLFWGPMLKIAILGQLDRRKEAEKHITRLKEIRPDFEEKASYLISRYIKESTLVEHVIEGLQKTGMKI